MSRSKAWHPAPLSKDMAIALQAMQRGEASDHQQKAILTWFVTEACQTYDEPFDPTNPRVTDYVLGRRSVGLAVVKHLNANVAVLYGSKED